MKHPITGLDHSPMICPHHHVSSSANAGQCMQCDKQRLNTTGKAMERMEKTICINRMFSIDTRTTYENEYDDSCEQFLPSRCNYYSKRRSEIARISPFGKCDKPVRERNEYNVNRRIDFFGIHSTEK